MILCEEWRQVLLFEWRRAMKRLFGENLRVVDQHVLDLDLPSTSKANQFSSKLMPYVQYIQRNPRSSQVYIITKDKSLPYAWTKLEVEVDPPSIARRKSNIVQAGSIAVFRCQV